MSQTLTDLPVCPRCGSHPVLEIGSRGGPKADYDIVQCPNMECQKWALCEPGRSPAGRWHRSLYGEEMIREYHRCRDFGPIDHARADMLFGLIEALPFEIDEPPR